MPDSRRNPRDVVAEFLPKNWSQDKRDERADEIVRALDEHELLVWDLFVAVEVPDARVTVETVHVYGLEIELDANGDAGRVVSRGFVIADA